MSDVITRSSGDVPISQTGSASAIAETDSSGNLFANDFMPRLESTAAGTAVTAMTAASAFTQVVTGTGTKTFKLPDATTFSRVGAMYLFVNKSDGALTIKDAANASLASIPAASAGQMLCSDVGSAAGVWDTLWIYPTPV